MNRRCLVSDVKNPEYPLVSVIMPARNEEHYIGECLDSILANDYPHDRLEIVIVDGMSADGTREVVGRYMKDYLSIRLLDNPDRVTPTALNIGIRAARGEIVVRVDAHALYAVDYIRRCVELLQTSGADSVGGVQRCVGTNFISNAISVAVTSPFGIGNAHYRYVEREMWVDTVYLGAWWKSTLEAVGGFDETWLVNQDYELNHRLRKSGKRILLSPSIKCWYYVRPTLKGLLKQYFRYGFWKVKTLRKHPDSLMWRQLIPPAFIFALVLSLALTPILGKITGIVPGLYLLAAALVSAKLVIRDRFQYIFILPVIFPIIHLAWGAGFIGGLFKWGIPRLTLGALLSTFIRPNRAANAINRDGGR